MKTASLQAQYSGWFEIRANTHSTMENKPTPTAQTQIVGDGPGTNTLSAGHQEA